MCRPDLLTAQAASGAFPCTIEWRGRPDVRDENGFATALVLRRLRRLRVISPVTDRALDFLESCADEPPGAFSFWPPAARPDWAADVPADADDTAVLTHELLAHGRLTHAQAMETVFDVLVASVTGPPVMPGPPWLRAGVFPTWLAFDGPDRTIVDCAVNANVLALMAVLGATHLPGYRQAIEMIDAAVDWCGRGSGSGAWLRADTIAPYYASPHAVRQVLDDAVWSGVLELRSARDRLAALIGPTPACDNPPLWRNAYAGPVWRCSSLAALPRPACDASADV